MFLLPRWFMMQYSWISGCFCYWKKCSNVWLCAWQIGQPLECTLSSVKKLEIYFNQRTPLRLSISKLDFFFNFLHLAASACFTCFPNNFTLLICFIDTLRLIYHHLRLFNLRNDLKTSLKTGKEFETVADYKTVTFSIALLHWRMLHTFTEHSAMLFVVCCPDQEKSSKLEQTRVAFESDDFNVTCVQLWSSDSERLRLQVKDFCESPEIKKSFK